MTLVTDVNGNDYLINPARVESIKISANGDLSEVFIYWVATGETRTSRMTLNDDGLGQILKLASNN